MVYRTVALGLGHSTATRRGCGSFKIEKSVQRNDLRYVFPCFRLHDNPVAIQR